MVLATNWWSLVIRGLVALTFGFVTFAWPGITLAGLVLLFGAYAIVDGVFAIIGAWRASHAHDRWGALVFEGITGLVAGLLTLLWPAISALALVYVIAAWSLVTGILEVSAAIRLRKQISGEWYLALSGIASILFGFFAAAMPLIGALAIALAVGVYAIVFGILLLALGIKLRHWTRSYPTGSSSIPLRA